MKFSESYAYGLWTIVLVNILFFLVFAFLFVFPKKRVEWRSMSIFSAFVAALYTEMYGFPLTIYVLASLLGKSYPTPAPFQHQKGHLWSTLTGWKYADIFCSLGSLMMIGGMVLVWLGWSGIHKAKGNLVKEGIYRYVRHPQYLGLILITTGMLIQWPTFITLLMWPLLLAAYIRLARFDDRDLEAKFGEDYLAYAQEVPAFIPLFFGRVRMLLSRRFLIEKGE